MMEVQVQQHEYLEEADIQYLVKSAQVDPLHMYAGQRIIQLLDQV